LAEETKTSTIRRNKSKSQRQTRLIILLVGLVFLAGSLYTITVYVLSYLAGLDMVAEMSWENIVDGPAWTFQRELVTTSDERGVLIPIVNEGDRVSKGLEIARVNYLGDTRLNEPSNRRIYSPVAGIVSFEPDGLELISASRDYDELTVKKLEEMIGSDDSAERGSQGFAGLIQDKLEREGWEAGEAPAAGADRDAQSPAEPVKTQPREVAGGAAIVKVTDNLSDCYVYMRIPPRDEIPFLPMDTVTMRTDDGSSGKGTVLRYEEIPAGWGLLIKLESGLEPLRHDRRHQISLVLGTVEMTAVPAGSVVMKDGEMGLYTVEKNKIRWKPVTVVDEKEGFQIIEGLEPGGVGPGDIIATRPWLIWDGMRLRD